ncbi:NAD(P)-binding protein [Marasmius fiardii PR-910]|nr:NAD(P)-binding protein [Marasmius fiardii PR-910]
MTTITHHKRVLITGATGRQGLAVVRALLRSQKEKDPDNFHILALTRNAHSRSAEELGKFGDQVTVVEGDLSSVESMRQVFDRWKEMGGIWGVFSVQAYPGLGVDASGEELQGKVIADVALEYGVSCFIYSSSERAEEIHDAEAPEGSSFLAKVRIERHIKELGKKGLRWTLLRPVRFMENYTGSYGTITFSVFKAGLRPTTAMDLVAVDDVGRIVMGVFKNPEPYHSQILVPLGDRLTCSQQEEIYKKVTGQPISRIPNVVALGVWALNKHTRAMLQTIEKPSEAYAEGKLPHIDSQVAAAKKAAGGGLTSFEEWSRQRGHAIDRSARDSSESGAVIVLRTRFFAGFGL